MAAWSQYGVFLPGNRWALTTNKKKALACAREHGGTVTRMAYDGRRGPWDAPTFRALSDVIADYRGEHVSLATMVFDRREQ